MRRYNNHLHPVDAANISRLVWLAGREYGERLSKPGMGAAKRPIDLIKAYYLCYLTAVRPSELLSVPAMVIAQEQLKTWYVVKITRSNERSAENMIKTWAPVDRQYEKLMWDFVTDSGERFNLDYLIAGFVGTSRNHLCNRFKHSFRMDLTDGKNILLKKGITPDMLRSFREYSLLKKGYPYEYVRQFLGLSPGRRFSKGWIKDLFKERSQLALIEETLQRASESRNVSFKIGT